jgi:hypothetical protein
VYANWDGTAVPKLSERGSTEIRFKGSFVTGGMSTGKTRVCDLKSN